MNRCPHCKSRKINQLKSTTSLGYRQFCCHNCAKQFNERTGTMYNFLEFPTDVVMLTVFYYYHFLMRLKMRWVMMLSIATANT